MLTDFHNSFTDRLASKFAIKSTLNIPPHLTNVATLPCEISGFKKCRTQGLNNSNCHVRLSYPKSLLKYTCPVMIPLFNSVIKILLAAMLEISHHWLYATATTKQRCRGKKPQLTSGRSVTDSVNLSVSESNWSTASLYLLMLKSELLQKQQLITTATHKVIWRDLRLWAG